MNVNELPDPPGAPRRRGPLRNDASPAGKRAPARAKPPTRTPWEKLRERQREWQHDRLVDLVELLEELIDLLPRLNAGQQLGVLFGVEAAFIQVSATVGTLRAVPGAGDSRSTP